MPVRLCLPGLRNTLPVGPDYLNRTEPPTWDLFARGSSRATLHTFCMRAERNTIAVPEENKAAVPAQGTAAETME